MFLVDVFASCIEWNLQGSLGRQLEWTVTLTHYIIYILHPSKPSSFPALLVCHSYCCIAHLKTLQHPPISSESKDAHTWSAATLLCALCAIVFLWGVCPTRQKWSPWCGTLLKKLTELYVLKVQIISTLTLVGADLLKCNQWDRQIRHIQIGEVERDGRKTALCSAPCLTTSEEHIFYHLKVVRVLG